MIRVAVQPSIPPVCDEGVDAVAEGFLVAVGMGVGVDAGVTGAGGGVVGDEFPSGVADGASDCVAEAVGLTALVVGLEDAEVSVESC